VASTFQGAGALLAAIGIFEPYSRTSPTFTIEEAITVSRVRYGLFVGATALVTLAGIVGSLVGLGVPAAVGAAALTAFGFPYLEKAILKALGIEE
jgi:hypothetical protein